MPKKRATKKPAIQSKRSAGIEAKAPKRAKSPPAAEQSEWRFRARAKQDPRNFGNAALYATPQEIESLVRETGQNSLDAAIGVGGRKQVVMRYRLVELPQGCARRDRFLKAIQWQEGLKPHLEAVARSQGKATNTAARVRSALRELNGKNSTLWLLAVEDYGTRGLHGDEFDSDSPYCALIRDSENSNKSDATAGGSFGLGSKTLFACSDLLTAIFASEPQTNPGKTRLIGKADLGFHDYTGGAAHGFVGHGHFGEPFEADAAVSQWMDARDTQLLHDLCVVRRCPIDGISETGTTALIVAFADPKADTQSAEGILDALRRAVARNFWPAIVREEFRVFLRHERADDYFATDEEVNPDTLLPSFVDAYRKQVNNQLETSLTLPGDVVSVPVQHTIPATKQNDEDHSGHPNLTAEARLVIRLSDPHSVDFDLRDHIALVRGRAMVVRYLPKKHVTLGARPYHAILAAGTLVSSSGHQKSAEEFLRFAEPPAHDKWEPSVGLRSRYAWGAGTRLQELFNDTTRHLRDYVGSKQEGGEDIPEVLKDVFRIADSGRPKQSSYKLSAPTLSVMAQQIAVAADVECPDGQGHVVRPLVTFATEVGKGMAMRWITLTASHGEVADGKVIVPAGTRRFRFEGTLEGLMPNLDLSRCAYQVAIRGARNAGDE